MNKVIILLLLTMTSMVASAQVEDTTYVDVIKLAKMESAKLPKYKSGMPSVVQYITNNLRYPKEAEKNGVEAKVKIDFIVEKDGSLSNIVPSFTGVHFFDVNKMSQKTGISEQELIDHYGKLFQEEGIRILSTMPKWKPGKLDDRTVRVKYTMPVTFTIPRFTGFRR